jgi:ubiquinone/menaquinone biosynthesis C-methylase UbiE
VYDRENKEINKILYWGRVKNKDNILVIGAYGALCISFKLLRYAEYITAVHSDWRTINYCKKKNTEINFKTTNIINSGFASNQFDMIISIWSGLHYQKNKSGTIRELKRILKDKGALLTEEADETSEYVKILNLISPNKKERIREKRKELKNLLEENFDVNEKRLTTYYRFQNKNQCRKYFEKEITFDEKRKFTQEMADKLEGYLSKKKTLKIQEKSIFFICKKKS